MCSRSKLQKNTSSQQTLSVGSFRKSGIANPEKGDNEPLKNDNSVSINRVCMELGSKLIDLCFTSGGPGVTLDCPLEHCMG